MHKKEEEEFTQCTRAQINTSRHKECTYYAVTPEGRRVFVKGPYVDKKQANLQIIVHEFKRMLCPSLPRVECKIEQYQVCIDGARMDFDNGWTYVKGEKDCANGTRCLWMPNKTKTARTDPAWFLVCDNLIQGPLPLKKANVGVLWPKAVDVVDYSKIPPNTFQHAWYSDTYAESMFTKLDSRLMRQYVLHALFAWVCGSSADLAMRNFFVHDNEMYAVDLEDWAMFEKNDWGLADTTVASSRTRCNEQIHTFVESQWSLPESEPFHLGKTLETALANLQTSGRAFFLLYDSDITPEHRERRCMAMIERLQQMFQNNKASLDAVQSVLDLCPRKELVSAKRQKN